MFQWTQSGPFHSYGFGISRVLFDESDDLKYVGLGGIWGHAGSSDNFMYYWLKRDAIMVGTLNQLACKRKPYGNVASVMHTVKFVATHPPAGSDEFLTVKSFIGYANPQTQSMTTCGRVAE